MNTILFSLAPLSQPQGLRLQFLKVNARVTTDRLGRTPSQFPMNQEIAARIAKLLFQ